MFSFPIPKTYRTIFFLKKKKIRNTPRLLVFICYHMHFVFVFAMLMLLFAKIIIMCCIVYSNWNNMLSYWVPMKYYLHLMKFVLDSRAKESSMEAHVHSHELVINNIPHLADTCPWSFMVIFFSLYLWVPRCSSITCTFYWLIMICMAFWGSIILNYGFY